MRIVLQTTRFLVLLSLTLYVATLGTGSVRAQEVTNWVVFNDYVPGPAPDPTTGWGTAPNVNVYNLRGTPGQPPEPVAGPLTDYLTGDELPISIDCVANGSPDFFGSISYPDVGTPAYNLFNGIVDIGNQDSAIGCRSSSGTTTTFTFSGLDPGKRYIFRGTAVRGNNYLNRWTRATIQGADIFVDAHTTGVYTSDTFTTGTLAPGDAAWNSGENRADGALVGWDEIRTGLDGSFSVHCEQLIDDPLPNGLAPALGNYGYAICGFMLAEVGAPTPIVITVEPPPSITLEENRPLSLTVGVEGSLPTFQWYLNDTPIDGATRATYSVAHASLADAGTYHVVVNGFLNSETSMDAEVTVNEDVTDPASIEAVGDGSLTRIYLAFNEELDPTTAEDSFNYDLQPSGGGVGGGAPGITSATLTNNGTAVVLETGLLAENTVYTVTAFGVTDLAGNGFEGMNSEDFRSWLTTPGGGVLFEVFDTSAIDALNPAGASAIANLLNAADYPNAPFFRANLSVFDTREIFVDDVEDNYGARIRGLFIPPLSGLWRLYFRSDDAGQLFLNPTGPEASGKVMIIEETGCCGTWAKLRSAAFNLQAGQGYYIEAIYKEGAGGDFCKVAAALEGQGAPPSADAALVDPESLPGSAIGSPAAPADIGGALSIIAQPADTTVDENHSVTFSVNATNPSDLPISYQWKRGGIEILDANGSSYTFEATMADNDVEFSVQVAKLGSVLESSSATLTVTVDGTSPEVLRVSGSQDLTKVIIDFSEKLDAVNAEDSFNYGITGFTVSLAVLDASGTRVTLTLDLPLSPGVDYDLDVFFVTDLVGNELTSLESFPSFVLSSGFALEELYFEIAGVAVTDLTGDVKYPGAPDRVSYVNSVEGPLDTFDNYGTRLTGWLMPPVSGLYNFFMSSDDGGQFALNMIADDSQPANLMPICIEPTWNGNRNWVGTDRRNVDNPENRSSTLFPGGIMLEAGSRYYFEALAKEGGGGDDLGVTWQLPGAPLPVNGDPSISGVYVATLAESRDAVINITEQPVGGPPSGPEPFDATFSIGVSSTLGGIPSGAISYQWQSDTGGGFEDILGANGSSYTGTFMDADIGTPFRVVVYVPGATATSDAATLGVGGSPTLTITLDANGDVTVTWTPVEGYVLVESDTADGTYTPVTGNPQGTHTATAAEVALQGGKFYELRSP